MPLQRRALGSQGAPPQAGTWGAGGGRGGCRRQASSEEAGGGGGVNYSTTLLILESSQCMLLVAVTIQIGGGGRKGGRERIIYPKTDRKKRNRMVQKGWAVREWREERVSGNQEGGLGWGNKLKKGTS